MIFSLRIVQIGRLIHRDTLRGVGNSLGVVERRLLMVSKDAHKLENVAMFVLGI
jgi:hypothetical protein